MEAQKVAAELNMELKGMNVKESYQKIIEFLEEIHVSYKKYSGDKSLYLLYCYPEGF